MKKTRKQKDEPKKSIDKARLTAILFLSILVIVTGTLFSVKSFMNNEIGGGILGIIIALIIVSFALIVYTRGNSDLKNGFPLHDERSQRVIEKASSKAFYFSLYLLLLVGFLSDDIISFRDVSQATGITVGMMALLFAACWAYFNKKEL
ncbi:MAG: hypothetical protein ABIH34_02695 [Nanoarchaeota archaeon]